MHRFTLALIGAWLIGIATAVAWPGITTERTMIAITIPPDEIATLNQYAVNGWIVIQAVPGRYYVLERPRLRLP